jgi:hypothetical protein
MQVCKNAIYSCVQALYQDKSQEDRLPNLDIRWHICAQQDTKVIGALIIYVIYNNFSLMSLLQLDNRLTLSVLHLTFPRLHLNST